MAGSIATKIMKYSQSMVIGRCSSSISKKTIMTEYPVHTVYAMLVQTHSLQSVDLLVLVWPRILTCCHGNRDTAVC